MKQHTMRANRECNVCCCTLYLDEPGRYCQDCRTVVKVIQDSELGKWWKRLPPDEYQARQERIEKHAERVTREMEFAQ